MKLLFTSFLSFCTCLFFLSACSEDDSDPTTPATTPDPVVINSIAPEMGKVGAEVMISGEHFNEDVTHYEVYFNETLAEIISGTSEELTVSVPENASSGPVSIRTGSETVTGPNFTVLKDEVEFNDFSDTGGLIMLATGFQFENGFRLTSAKTDRTGVVYYGAKLNVRDGFETTFDFIISDPGGIEDGEGKTGADGLAFLIQNQSADAIGNQGGSLGYANIENSLAIEFDTFGNTAESDYPNGETNGNHVSVQTNGKEANSPSFQYSIGYSEEIPELMDGEVHSAKVVYQGNNLMVYIDDFDTPAIDIEVDLDTLLDLDEGLGYVGFSSSTGQAYANHDILNWTFVPEN